MPRARIDDSLLMYYELDNFTEPWTRPETILLVHGIAESSAVWYAWVPRLAQKYAVLRVDVRGWGKSSIPPKGYQWSMANFARDIKVLLDKLKLGRVHLVGAKTGGTISLQFAHDYPERLLSLAVISSPVKWGARPIDYGKIIQEKGLEYWARATMRNRLGDVPNEMLEWWVKLFTSSSPRVLSEVQERVSKVDITGLLPEIGARTLVITGESTVLATRDEFEAWQKTIPRSRLVVIPSKAYHLAAAEPEKCVKSILDFLGQKR